MGKGPWENGGNRVNNWAWIHQTWIGSWVYQATIGMVEALEEVFNSSRLDILPDTRRFLIGSGTIEDIWEIRDILMDVCEDFFLDRIYVYRLTKPEEAEILLCFSRDDEEIERAWDVVLIEKNINLKQAAIIHANGKRYPSQEPVPGVGTDFVFSCGRPDKNIFIGVDTIDSARKFSLRDQKRLINRLKLLPAPITAWEAIHARGIDEWLTKLANRLALDYAIDRGVDIFWEPISPIQSVAFFDIDKFKQFNSDHGHHHGDVVLKHVASILQQTVRALGWEAFRYGGEELVAAFPRVVTKEEIDFIRQEIEKSICKFEWKTHKVTVSVGLCVAERDEPFSFKLQKRLIRVSNAAMNEAKEWWRNMTVELPFVDPRGESES